MAFQPDNQDLQTREAQFRDVFLNLSKGQEELKALLAMNLVKISPEDNKGKRLEQLQDEFSAMKTQMMGQMALIQGLSREQEELRIIINQLHQDRYNNMKQIVEAGDQVIYQPPRRQGFGLVKGGPFQIATTSRVQQRPRQHQRGNQRRQNESERQFTKINMPPSQALRHMLGMHVIMLIGPHPNPKTSSPNYNPDARCAYHSDNPGHDTNNCWALKYKIQNMIQNIKTIA